MIGLIRFAEGDASFDKAIEVFTESMEIAQPLQLRPLLARIDLCLGQLQRRARNVDQARRHLTSAQSLLREMQMPMWLQKAEAELQALQ